MGNVHDKVSLSLVPHFNTLSMGETEWDKLCGSVQNLEGKTQGPTELCSLPTGPCNQWTQESVHHSSHSIPKQDARTVTAVATRTTGPADMQRPWCPCEEIKGAGKKGFFIQTEKVPGTVSRSAMWMQGLHPFALGFALLVWKLLPGSPRSFTPQQTFSFRILLSLLHHPFRKRIYGLC